MPSKVTVANGAVLDSPGRGSLVLPTSLGGELTLTRTLLVPDLATNLFSVRAADRAGGEIRFYGGGVTVIPVTTCGTGALGTSNTRTCTGCPRS